MTETTEVNHRNEVRVGAFLSALLLAPVMPILITGMHSLLQGEVTSAFALTVASIPFGGPAYLAIGAPVLWLTLRNVSQNPVVLMASAIFAHAVTIPILLHLYGMEPLPPMVPATWPDLRLWEMIAGLGLVFSATWGFAFGHFYTWFIALGDRS